VIEATTITAAQHSRLSGNIGVRRDETCRSESDTSIGRAANSNCANAGGELQRQLLLWLLLRRRDGHLPLRQ
jgi:hypothetical protein